MKKGDDFPHFPEILSIAHENDVKEAFSMLHTLN